MDTGRIKRLDFNIYKIIEKAEDNTTGIPENIPEEKKVKKGGTGNGKGFWRTFATTATIVTACVVVATILNSLINKKPSDDMPTGTIVDKVEQGDSDNKVQAITDEMRGVWVASVGNLNYPSKKGLSEQQLKNEIDAILEDCRDVGFNTIFFQVRPCADALYKSDIYPWSEFVTGIQGKAPENNFDSLGYILEKAPEYGIAVHAWVNPFRVTNGSATNPKHNVEELSENHPARLNPDYVVAYSDGKLYFDPGNPDAREVIISGIEELCTIYPGLAGIHIDDYFYPYPVSGADFDDSVSYEKHGYGMDKGDWRRNNVNIFVKEAYDTVKSVDENMQFGVSPFGIWANDTSKTSVKGSSSSGLEAYFSLYCDALSWVNGGYVDYLVPQIYWSFATTAAPFDNIARWWNAQLDGTGVDLYIGHAAYKAQDYAKNEIPIQVEFSRNLISYKGSVFYGYADIKKNTAGVRDDIKRSFENVVESEKDEVESQKLRVTYPTAKTTTQTSGYILGISDVAYPLTVNGEKISRTKDGYFSLYKSFTQGENVYELKNGDETLIYTIKRGTSSGGSASAIPEMANFEILSATPEKPLWLIPGDVVSVTCVAPSGSKVYAKFGEYTIEMKPTIYSATTDKNYKETYKGSITVSKIHAKQGELADIGVLTVYAQKNGKTAEKTLSEVKQMGGDVKIYAQVKNDYSYLKNSTTSSFYDDPLPASIGMRDYITAYVNGYYKLRCGYYISDEDVEVVFDKELFENRVLSATVSTNIKDSSNNLHNSTDITFGVLENVPINAYIKNGVIRVIFFSSDTSFVPTVAISENPMIKSASGYVSNGRIIYDFVLKSAENYYGYNVVYENGFITLKLNNPQTVKEGDKPLSGKTIVVDAGHGGTDIGAQGPTGAKSGLNESDLNLYISLELKAVLQELGANVVMIRDDNRTVSLNERIEFLSNIIPDLMISVHHNSVVDTVNASKARGYVGLYSDDAGVLLANAVSDMVVLELSRYQRPTAYQALAVARNHRYPSTLCEMSFISNTEEFQWTTSEGNYRRSAEAIAKGVLEFYSRQEKYLKY